MANTVTTLEVTEVMAFYTKHCLKMQIQPKFAWFDLYVLVFVSGKSLTPYSALQNYWHPW